jgi:SAM-dependent methyltransferase
MSVNNDNPIQADDDFKDEGFAASTNTSYLTSLASSIRRGIEENGRIYANYGRNLYGLPVDDEEQDRNDLQHCKIALMLDGKLHAAPISETPQNILDLGTGSGIWAIDMADRYPTTRVIGNDIAPVQPTVVPPNCEFEIEDIETDWPYRKSSFDFIHCREFLLAIRDWQRLINQSFEHLQPGGYLEISGTYPHPASDDNTLPEDSAYVEFGDTMRRIADILGTPIDAPAHWRRQMELAGFEDVHETIYKMPSSPWPKDKRMKQIGAFELTNFSEGAEAFMLRGYTQILGGSLEEAQVLFARARSEVRNRAVHAYVYL